MGRKQNLYEMLHVSESASTEQIREAFVVQSELVRRNDAGLADQEVSDRLQMLKLALTTLTDSVTRHAYDTRLRAQANTRALVADGHSGQRRRASTPPSRRLGSPRRRPA